MARKREKQIKFFVTDEESEKIERKIEKSKLSKSDYLRKCSLEKEIIIIDDLKELYIEIKKQGNNLNQLAKAVNEKRVENIGNINETIEEYKKLNNILLELVRKT